jgi:hypothetical protein
VERIARFATNGWVCGAALALSAGVSLWSVARVPEASPLPLVLGLIPFALGKYVLCPLRWHALSASGRGRWWHVRAYAESELLGLLAPVHAAADLWRVRRLQTIGLGNAVAVGEVALDRLVGTVAIIAVVVLSGIALPVRIMAVLAVIAAVVVAVLVIGRRRRPDLFSHPLPRPRIFVAGVGLSLGYQAGIAALVLGAVTAVGGSVDPIALVAVFGASQLASVLPGLDGLNPRSGALAAGLASAGVSWAAALGAVALVALLPWVPALVLGGGSFVAQRAATTWRSSARSLLMTPVTPSQRA